MNWWPRNPVAGFVLGASIGLAIYFGGYAIASAGMTPPTPAAKNLAPPIPCTMGNRMDIYIDRENGMWECICSVIWSHFDCHWQLVGIVQAADVRKRILARYHYIPRMRLVVV